MGRIIPIFNKVNCAYLANYRFILRTMSTCQESVRYTADYITHFVDERSIIFSYNIIFGKVFLPLLNFQVLFTTRLMILTGSANWRYIS